VRDRSFHNSLLALFLAAVLVPEDTDAVLSIEDASGLRALLGKAGTYAPSLAPELVGATLRDRVGIDLLAESPAWGLAQGARMLAFSRNAMGLSVPLRDASAAKKTLSSWLAQDPRRAGRIVRSRLLTASGQDATTLLAAMSRRRALPPDLAARAKGPVWIWARLAEPLRAIVLSVDASGTGLLAGGIVTAKDAILSGRAPLGCENGIGCLRAGLGPAGRRALAVALEQLTLPAHPELARAERVEQRLEAIDARQLSVPGSLSRALRIVPVFDAPEGPPPALEARVNLAAIDAALATMTPLDALRGALAAGAYAAHLLYGRLLRNAGPLLLTGNSQRGSAAEIDLRLPLR
jgi:hypothetical protein